MRRPASGRTANTTALFAGAPQQLPELLEQVGCCLCGASTSSRRPEPTDPAASTVQPMTDPTTLGAAWQGTRYESGAVQQLSSLPTLRRRSATSDQYQTPVA